ncbi:hypothetical protein Zmor_025484 [Zophobas morio]|uniref:BRCT domain-containing protein n=1 Tax=Zophobas morio TaxID=2755281 RepID=A0AA38M431_9CUCU|nr:hypothetical protein Zmor_025484 [Zophobas morio]
MENIRVLFILPEGCSDQTQASELMCQAYESCQQNVVNVSWLEESKLDSTDLSKTDFVVFQDFKGRNFNSLKESKCARILGPWCLLVCLMEGRSIPNFTWPIYNVAMSGVVVSCSHILKARKSEIKEKVQLMGGCYTDSLMSTNTHLVTESVKSEKYLQAGETGLKLYVSKWVDAVWEASQTSNIHCDDEQFNKYKCPPFHSLTISSTGFSNVEMRAEIAQTIAKYGGIFTANLSLSTTDVLIVHGDNGLLSKKYKAVRTNPNIFCVSVDWVHDSIAKGYALPHKLYNVNKKGTSTPTRDDEAGPDFSLISAIGDMSRMPNTFEESVIPKRLQPSVLFPKKISPNKRKCSAAADVGRLIDGLDIKKAKKAGQYLDGCSVYLAGFIPDQREKLAKILNLSGATRYDDISDRLTHIIVGDTTCPEVKIIKTKNYSVSLVSLQWLLDSMENQQIADEENYLINLHDFDKEQFSSPLGKKGLSLLRSKKTMTSNDFEAASTSARNSQDLEPEDDIMQQYLKPASKNEDSDTLAQLLKNNSDFNSKPDAGDSKRTTDLSSEFSQSSQDDRSTQDTNIFYSKKFVIVNFSMEEAQYVKQQIESVLGTVMAKSYKGIPDYVVAPAFVKAPVQASALEVVNQYWISESIQHCEDLEIEYYFRPFVVCDSKPLVNCVVTVSGHTGAERIFLKGLIETLGGDFQDQFARVMCVEKNVKASTHLVSLSTEGKKYVAALKWGLPVVAKEWLFECAKSGKFVPEEGFLMGESKAPSRSSSVLGTPVSRNKVATPIVDKRSTPIVDKRSTPVVDNRSTPMADKRCTPIADKRSTPSSSTWRKVLTPVSQLQPLDVCKNEKTPINQRLFEAVPETPCTQVTPINKLMEEVRKTNLLGTPQTPPMPKTWYDVDTPESPFGAFIRPHLSPKSKKELMRYINQIPDFVPPPKGRKSTPLSEVKRRCWAKLLGSQESPRFTQDKTESAPSTSHVAESDRTNNIIEQHDEVGDDKEGDSNGDIEMNDDSSFINTKLKQIEEMVSAFSEKRRSSRTFQATASAEVGKVTMKDSQPFSVGWDYEENIQSEPLQPPMRIFMISGVDSDRQQMVEKIEQLGGHVSELSSYDSKCTHLICPKPARNEKTLSCMASGKWILHISYVDKSIAAGKFLPEENFEFGNPKAKDNIKETFDKENDARIQSIHWWRKEISRRGYGAFNDMRAIVVAQRRDPIVRVIEAGGGQIVDAAPPFSENVYATHCLLEARSVPDFSVYIPLAQRGILCINTLYISDFLYRINKDIKDAIVPHFSKYYS